MQLLVFLGAMLSLFVVFSQWGFWAGVAWMLFGLPILSVLLNLLLGGILFGAAKAIEAVGKDEDKAA